MSNASIKPQINRLKADQAVRQDTASRHPVSRPADFHSALLIRSSWPWADGRCRIGAEIAATVATSSWSSLSGPPVAARAGGDGPDKPGHDGIANIVPPAPYFNANAADAAA